jgi:hypothetical protein
MGDLIRKAQESVEPCGLRPEALNLFDRPHHRRIGWRSENWVLRDKGVVDLTKALPRKMSDNFLTAKPVQNSSGAISNHMLPSSGL